VGWTAEGRAGGKNDENEEERQTKKTNVR